MRQIFIWACITVSALLLIWAYYWIDALYGFVIVLPIVYMGVADMLQTRQSIKRNFPVIGRLRYFFEMIRPEIQQYFVESDVDGAPINRNERSVIYQRAKKQIDTIPFGTQMNV